MSMIPSGRTRILKNQVRASILGWMVFLFWVEASFLFLSLLLLLWWSTVSQDILEIYFLFTPHLESSKGSYFTVFIEQVRGFKLWGRPTADLSCRLWVCVVRSSQLVHCSIHYHGPTDWEFLTCSLPLVPISCFPALLQVLCFCPSFLFLFFPSSLLLSLLLFLLSFLLFCMCTIILFSVHYLNLVFLTFGSSIFIVIKEEV